MAKFDTLKDSFSGPVLQTALWAQFTGGSATITYDSTGATVVYPASTTSSTDGDLTSVGSFDLTASYAMLQVLAVPNVGAPTNTDAQMRLGTTTNGLAFLVEGGTIFAQQWVATVKTNQASATYDPVAHAWWRIRETRGTTFWETSSNGQTWVVFFSVANPITVTSLTVLLAGTAFGTSVSPGTFKFNNFNIPPAIPYLPVRSVNRYVGPRAQRSVFHQPQTFGVTSVADLVSASIAQIAAVITAGGGTQVEAVSASIAQVAATITATGGTQAVATINNVAIAQVAATITAAGGTQVIASSRLVSIAQVAAVITAGGGVQTDTTVRDVAITQVAAVITAGGGTQTIATVNKVAIAQVAAVITAGGGTQVVGLAGGQIKVWSGSAWVRKPVKVWNGSAWVAKPMKRWTGTVWKLL